MTATAPSPTRDLSQRVRPALATWVLTTAYYASPDVVRSRALRAVVKTALAAAVTTVSMRDVREVAISARASFEEAFAAAEPPVDAPAVKDLVRRAPAGPATAVAASVGGVVGASIALTIAGERWIFRRGQARAAAGARLPHTAPALLWGAIAALTTLVPGPPAGEHA